MSNHTHPLGELIHQQYDEFGRLDVVETATARSLYFGTEVEQCRFIFDASMRLPLEYQQVMEAQTLVHHQQNTSIQRILMLGMGGGSMARQLNTLLPKASIHIVELRQAVIDIAYDYFELPDVPEIEAIQEDALLFVQNALSRYDVIIVDLFDEAGIPKPFTQPSFQRDLEKNVSKNGLILFNLWANQAPEAQAQTQHVLDYWQSQSPDNILLNTYPILSTENIILSIQQHKF